MQHQGTAETNRKKQPEVPAMPADAPWFSVPGDRPGHSATSAITDWCGPECTVGGLGKHMWGSLLRNAGREAGAKGRDLANSVICWDLFEREG